MDNTSTPGSSTRGYNMRYKHQIKSRYTERRGYKNIKRIPQYCRYAIRFMVVQQNHNFFYLPISVIIIIIICVASLLLSSVAAATTKVQRDENRVRLILYCTYTYIICTYYYKAIYFLLINSFCMSRVQTVCVCLQTGCLRIRIFFRNFTKQRVIL